MAYILLMVTFWSWQKSCAHFNAAITVGQLMYSLDRLSKKSLMTFGMIIFAQILGGLVGIILAFQSSDYVDLNDNQKQIRPAVLYLCTSVANYNCGN
jgi:glycerol uptake facilitator-like aquaporin